MPTQLSPFDPSSNSYLDFLDSIASSDVAGLKKAQESYGESWKQRGGCGAFMMLARKWDRLERRCSERPNLPGVVPDSGLTLIGDRYDIFGHIEADQRSEGVIDDIRDLRRYLTLVEAEMLSRGFEAGHRDNEKIILGGEL